MIYPVSKAYPLKCATHRPKASRLSQESNYRALVVSADTERQELLYQEATTGGWDVILCELASEALRVLDLQIVQLVIVDLIGPRGITPHDYPNVCQHLACQTRLFQVICGHNGNTQEEIWARQLGVWIYLTDVLEVGQVRHVCETARSIARPGQRIWQRTDEIEAFQS